MAAKSEAQKADEARAQQESEALANQPGALKPGAPTKNQAVSIRDAKHPEEKPDPTTVAQVEEITDPDRG